MENGWIKIERSIIHHWIFQDAEYFRAWVLLILMANHEDRTILIRKRPMVVPRGSLYTSTRSLAKAFGWDRKKTVRFIDVLESDGMVSTNGTTSGTTLTIVNYDKYQGRGATNGTTNGTTDGATHGTTDGATDGTRTRMDKNEKNEKNVKNNTTARTRARRPNSFLDYDQRHTDYDSLFGAAGLIGGSR